jgi:hypothetical protein
MPSKKRTTRPAAPEAAAPESEPSAPPPAGSLLSAVGEAWSYDPSGPVKTDVNPRSGLATKEPVLPAFIEEDGDFALLESGELRGGGRRSSSGASTSILRLAAEVPEDADVLLVLRHESGAFTFHRPNVASGRRTVARAGGASLGFEIPLPAAAITAERRGPVSKLLKVALIRVTKAAREALIGKLTDWSGEQVIEWLVPKVALRLEEEIWKRQKRTAGWLRVTEQALAAKEDRMTGAKPAFAAGTRGLLFIHGTFSSAHGGFRNLAGTDFLKQVAAIYGGNLFAFNHFTFSKTPQENAMEMLEALPEGEFEFDVITHSRGGLVLRELMEGATVQHPLRGRLRIGRVMMVACPSAGTPLADFDTWEKRFSYIANLLDVLPDHPFVTGASWLAEGLKWAAANLLGNFPGLTAMEPDGEYLRSLQGAPAGASYHAVVSNFHPTESMALRLADLGADLFFKGANDLVVPTEGGWMTAADSAGWIPGGRIACFGPGGNAGEDQVIHHGGFFGNHKTVDFMLAVLHGDAPALSPVDPLAALPSRGRRQSRALVHEGVPIAGARAMAAGPEFAAAEVVKAAVKEAIGETDLISIQGWDEEDTLYLTIIASGHDQEFSEESGSSTLLLAQYGSARVAQPLYTRNVKQHPEDPGDWTPDDKKRAGSRIRDIIAMQRFMLQHTNGERPAPYKTTDEGISRVFATPDEKFLRLLGKRLFRVLITGQVVRLYDAITHRHRRKRVNIIFTSMLPWLSDLPWEMLYDPDMDCHIATSNVRFLRNVLTPIPADKIDRDRKKLRILVAAAQANGASYISYEQETQRIRDSFRTLTELGLVEVDVIARCTPDALHKILRCSDERAEYDVLHFIGHGCYDKEEGGFLEFVDDNGDSWPITANEFARIIRSRGIRIVFLNSCESGLGHGNSRDENSGKGSNYNKGVAIELAKDGLPAVVANQYSVVDTLASLFALHFYNCLAHGLPIADAVREARIAVSYSEDAEAMDWGVPVLFARNPNANLCARRAYDPDLARRAVEREVGKPTTRRGAGEELVRRKRDYRIVVWTSSATLLLQENLRGMLAEMTACQPSFEFVLRKRRIPASIWKIDDSEGYLNAHDILEPVDEIRKAEFKADFLIFITDFPMMTKEDKVEALYYYSPQERGLATMLFSTWGFEPPLGGESAKSALANHTAIALLDHFAQTPATCETRGSSDSSPGFTDYFNDERSLDHISGPMFIPPVIDSVVRHRINEGRFTERHYASIKSLLKLYHPDHNPDGPH